MARWAQHPSGPGSFRRPRHGGFSARPRDHTIDSPVALPAEVAGELPPRAHVLRRVERDASVRQGQAVVMGW
jgi:hypothetical protein